MLQTFNTDIAQKMLLQDYRERKRDVVDIEYRDRTKNVIVIGYGDRTRDVVDIEYRYSTKCHCHGLQRQNKIC